MCEIKICKKCGSNKLLETADNYYVCEECNSTLSNKDIEIFKKDK